MKTTSALKPDAPDAHEAWELFVSKGDPGKAAK